MKNRKGHRFSENMFPGNIDFRYIDKPLIPLIGALNKTDWIVTIGSCMGKPDFYIILEVKGIRGIEKLIKLLSSAHKTGFEACYNRKIIKSCACYDARLITPNYLQGDFSNTSAAMGKNWYRFYLTITYCPNYKNSVIGGVWALEQSLTIIERN